MGVVVESGAAHTRKHIGMKRRRTLGWLIVSALIAAACAGSGVEAEPDGGNIDGDREAVNEVTTAEPRGEEPTSGADAAEEEDAGTAVLDDVGYELQSTGEVEFDHTGDAVCTVTKGQLDVEFSPDVASDLSYALSAVDFSQDRASYGVAFVVESDRGESMGSGFMTADVSDAGDGVLFFSGSFSAAFSGAAGEGFVEGQFGCLIEGSG